LAIPLGENSSGLPATMEYPGFLGVIGTEVSNLSGVVGVYVVDGRFIFSDFKIINFWHI
jgi:hypothetical protein